MPQVHSCKCWCWCIPLCTTTAIAMERKAIKALDKSITVCIWKLKRSCQSNLVGSWVWALIHRDLRFHLKADAFPFLDYVWHAECAHLEIVFLGRNCSRHLEEGLSALAFNILVADVQAFAVEQTLMSVMHVLEFALLQDFLSTRIPFLSWATNIFRVPVAIWLN